MPVDQTVLDARSAMQTAVSNYTIEKDCSNLAQARIAIQNYSDAVQTFKTNNPGTPEDDYFSNPTLQTQTRRDLFRDKMVGPEAIVGTGRSLLVGLWSTETTLSPSGASSARGVAFSPDNQWLVVGHSGGVGLTIYNTTTWIPANAIPSFAGYNILNVAVSAGSDYIALALSASPYLAIIRVSDWSTLDISAIAPSLTFTIKDLQWSPEVGTPQLAILQGDVYLLDVDDGTITIATPPPAQNTDHNAVSAAAYSPDGQFFAVGYSTSGKDTVVYNRSDWSVAYQTPFVQVANDITFSSDSAWLAIANDSWGSIHGMQLWDTATWTLQTQQEDILSNAQTVVFTHQNDVVLVTARDDQTYAYRLSDGSRIPCTPVHQNMGTFTYSADITSDGRLWAVSKANSEAVVVYEIFAPN